MGVVDGQRDAQPGPLAWALHHLAVAGAGTDVATARGLGVPAGDYLAVKHLLAADEPVGPVELGRLLGMSSGSATALVDRLERAGHVRRGRHPRDRRRQVLEVTPATRARVLALLAPLVDAVGELAAEFDPDQQRAIARFLAGVTARHRAHAAAGDAARAGAGPVRPAAARPR
jgi:DNA-binding MarR family transcriptional regulator